MLKIFNIESRRYIGSKTKLLSEILKACGDVNGKTFVDPFGGTGVVANKMINQGAKVIVNDMLYSNYVSYNAFFGSGKISVNKIKEMVSEWNSITEIKNKNYFSDNFSGKYFSENTARKIGFIREEISTLLNNGKINKQESFILITSLMYSMDKYANTVGHYEMFLKNIAPTDKLFEMGIVNISNRDKGTIIYNSDSNEIIDKLNGDIAYMDPPYNARQYINFYHIWENIAKWEKPELKWESMKFDRTNMKSKYSQSKAPESLKELVDGLHDTKKIIVSYNNTYNASSGASNNKISIEQMNEILSNDRHLETKELDHKHFNSGKTDFKNHVEYLYIASIN